MWAAICLRGFFLPHLNALLIPGLHGEKFTPGQAGGDRFLSVRGLDFGRPSSSWSPSPPPPEMAACLLESGGPTATQVSLNHSQVGSCHCLTPSTGFPQACWAPTGFCNLVCTCPQPPYSASGHCLSGPGTLFACPLWSAPQLPGPQPAQAAACSRFSSSPFLVFLFSVPHCHVDLLLASGLPPPSEDCPRTRSAAFFTGDILAVVSRQMEGRNSGGP